MGRKIRKIMEGEVPLPFGGKGASLLSYGHPLERRAILIMAALFVILSILYVYSVMSSVMHVASRQELSIEARKLSAEVALMEAEYLAKTQGITESYAKSHGFVAIQNRSFVEQSSSLSVNNPR